MKRLKIAQVVSLQESVPPKGKNGLEFMVYYLTEELVKRGHQVTLFATADSKTSAKLVSVVRSPAMKKWNFGWSSIDYSMASMVKVSEMADQFDVIHTHIGHTAYYFANLIKTPIIETMHSPIHKAKKIVKDYYSSDKIGRYKKIHHVFVSGSQRNNSLLMESSSVIHNGIDMKSFLFRDNAEDYYAYLGYITPNKGPHLAVRAAKIAGVKLKIAGSFKGCEEYFKKQIKPYLKKGYIEYVGVVNPRERNKLLGGAKALLIPLQWEEPFGLVMIEAMACGTPVIGFDRAAVPEIVKNGNTGFVVKDVKEMARAIKKIGEIKREDCRSHVEKYFTMQKMAEEYEKVYNKVINNFK
ncbi:MAG: glycosyltransferase family 4 protein [Minisyncoccia bacterium]